MAEIARRVRALREGDDAAKAEAVRALRILLWRDDANQVAIAEAGGIPPLVELLRDGSAGVKWEVAAALRNLAYNNANQALIAEAGGIPPLVELLRDGSADAKLWAAWALRDLADNNDANKVAIAEAGAIPPLVELLRDGSPTAKFESARALNTLASNNDANAVAIAVTVGSLEALVELARRGSVTVDNRSAVRGAGVPVKRKAALVVAELLRDYVPGFKSVPRDIKGLIGTYL